MTFTAMHCGSPLLTASSRWSSRRLVKEQHRRFRQHRAGDADQPRCALRKFGRTPVKNVAQLKLFDDLGHEGGGILPAGQDQVTGVGTDRVTISGD
jgi:hypothetical protein